MTVALVRLYVNMSHARLEIKTDSSKGLDISRFCIKVHKPSTFFFQKFHFSYFEIFILKMLNSDQSVTSYVSNGLIYFTTVPNMVNRCTF